jgi:hypothetical protein
MRLSDACLSISPIAPRIVFIQASALPSSITNSIEIFLYGTILLSSPGYIFSPGYQGSLPFSLDFE